MGSGLRGLRRRGPSRSGGADLEAFGVMRVPATIVGDRVVHGWNPKALAELVGVRYRAPKKLSPAELARRMDVVLAATQRAIRQVPREHLGMKYPGRDRTVHQLGFHVFRVAASFADTREQGHLDGAWFEENAPAEMADGDAVARYGETVRAAAAGVLRAARLVRRRGEHLLRPAVGARVHGAHDVALGPAPAADLLVPGRAGRGEGRAAHRRRPRGAAVPDGGLVVAG